MPDAQKVASGWTPRGLLVLAVLLGATACGGQPPLLVEPAAPTREPYEGPLHLDGDDPRRQDPSFRLNAAEGAVDCDSEPTGSFTSEPDTTLGVSATPEKALTRAWKKGALRGLQTGYRRERTEPTRVLFTVEVDGKPKQAVIMHHAPTRFFGTGWYLEAWARCDLAELPPAVAEKAGVEIWRDANGRRVPTTIISSAAGPRHCHSQHMTFLVLDADDPEQSLHHFYVGNADPELAEYFAEPYARDVALPADAVDTGYSREGRGHLWLSPDKRRAYVGNLPRVEMWPRTVKYLTCA